MLVSGANLTLFVDSVASIELRLVSLTMNSNSNGTNSKFFPPYHFFLKNEFLSIIINDVNNYDDNYKSIK